MDITQRTLKRLWQQIKIEKRGIRLQEASKILGCSDFDLLHTEFGLNQGILKEELISDHGISKKDLLSLLSSVEPIVELK